MDSVRCPLLSNICHSLCGGGVPGGRGYMGITDRDLPGAAMPHSALARAEAFCKAYNLRLPILLAPMAGACPASLSIAVAGAGGLGACGGLLMQPAAIK